jgi:hypothetical protein
MKAINRLSTTAMLTRMLIQNPSRTQVETGLFAAGEGAIGT